ncbi:hypothetical protein [Wolbachia endosymbiont of Cantharis cryptica]|uniref:hypothetical protein n=1 Tax=Wolbachia endosymbiont of Cantharis cryptica TaxID=3066132 RepID=UPI00376EAE77
MMKDFFDNSKFDSDDSSIFQGKILDFSAEQERNKLKEITEELARKAALKTLECERQASDQIDNILQLIKIDDDYFADSERLLNDFLLLFCPLFNFFDVDMGIGSKTYEMIKERREKNWLLSVIKLISDKLKELVKKIFSRDLSFDERLAKEIKELEEKLAGGGLSKEEFARVLNRLEGLQNLKLKLQMFVAGWLITTFAEIFAVNLVAAVETGTAKEEDKKAEKTSSKEANKKEVCEDAEIKVDEREKSKLMHGVIPALDAGIWLRRPTSLTTQEHNLFPNSLKKILAPMHELSIENNKSSQESRVKRKEEPKICTPVPDERKESEAVERKTGFRSKGMSVGGKNKYGNGNRNMQADAQSPRGLTDDVEVNHVNSMGRKAERTSSRG